MTDLRSPEFPISLAVWAPPTWPDPAPTAERYRVRGLGYVTHGTAPHATTSGRPAIDGSGSFELDHAFDEDPFDQGSGPSGAGRPRVGRGEGGSRVDARTPGRSGRGLAVPNRRRALIGAVSSLLTFVSVAGGVLAGPASAAGPAPAGSSTATDAPTTTPPPGVGPTSTSIDPAPTGGPGAPTPDPTTPTTPTTATTASTTPTSAPAPAPASPTPPASLPVGSGTTTASTVPAAPVAPSGGGANLGTDAPTTTVPIATVPTTTATGHTGPVATPAPPPPTSSTTTTPTTAPVAGSTSGNAVTGSVIQAAITFEPRPGEVASVDQLPGAATKAPVIGDVVALPTDDRPLDPLAGAAQLASTRHGAAIVAQHRLDELTAQATAIDEQLTVVGGTVHTLTERAFLVPEADSLPIVAQRQAAMATEKQLESAKALVQMQLVVADAEATSTVRSHDDARARLAALVADRLAVSATDLDARWQTTSPTRLDVMYAALAQVGDPYVWAAGGPDAFDCSGLTMFAWETAGVHLAHYTHTQRAQTLDASPDQLQAGDLIYNLKTDGTGHVMLSLGLGRLMVEAPQPGTPVQVGQWTEATGFGSPLDDRPAVADSLEISAH